GDGALRHFVDASEPAFPHLLAPARIVERHDQVRLFGVEISGWIVEGQVTVFADADEGDVNRACRELTPDLPAHLARIAIGLEQVEAGYPGRLNQPFAQVFAEAGRMRSEEHTSELQSRR